MNTYSTSKVSSSKKYLKVSKMQRILLLMSILLLSLLILMLRKLKMSQKSYTCHSKLQIQNQCQRQLKIMVPYPTPRLFKESRNKGPARRDTIRLKRKRQSLRKQSYFIRKRQTQFKRN